MQREWLTEYEWRSRYRKPKKRRPDWWGAQCIYPTGARRITGSRAVHRFLVALACTIAWLMPLCIPAPVTEEFAQVIPAEIQFFSARTVRAVEYRLPEGLVYQRVVFPYEQLQRGRMLDLSTRAPVDLPPPNTVSIAQYGSGMVPVRSLKARSGYDTIDALKPLFAQLRTQGLGGLYVDQGTVSISQQQDAMKQQMRTLMAAHPPSEAARLTAQALDRPGTGSLLQEYTVEIKNGDGTALEHTAQGQAFLQLCWRYGFVRESAGRPFRFRWTGKAHAAAMTYLDLDFGQYLDWMHRKGTLVIYAGGEPQYLILCVPMQGDYAVFDLPENAECEISMDNRGYALAACTL